MAHVLGDQHADRRSSACWKINGSPTDYAPARPDHARNPSSPRASAPGARSPAPGQPIHASRRDARAGHPACAENACRVYARAPMADQKTADASCSASSVPAYAPAPRSALSAQHSARATPRSAPQAQPHVPIPPRDITTPPPEKPLLKPVNTYIGRAARDGGLSRDPGALKSPPEYTQRQLTPSVKARRRPNRWRMRIKLRHLRYVPVHPQHQA